MWLFLDPLDVWLFRVGKPFQAGESHRARSVFPPPPSTLQGAIRSRVLVDAAGGIRIWEIDSRLRDPAPGSVDGDLRTAIGYRGDYGAVQLIGPFPAQYDQAGTPEMYLPLPADVLVSGSVSAERVSGVRLAPLNEVPTGISIGWPDARPSGERNRNGDSPLRPLVAEPTGSQDSPRAPDAGSVLTVQDLKAYLDPGKPFDARLTDMVLSDSRTGVEISAMKTVVRSRLMTVDFRRLRLGSGLAIRVRGVDGLLRGHGTLRLGGESRSAAYWTITNEPDAETLDVLLGQSDEAVVEHVRETGRFKLYFLTATAFEHGWLPDFLDPDTLRTSSKALGEGLPLCTLVGAAIGKPGSIGGWDLIANRPKATRLAIPPGSVYHFQLDHSRDAPAAVRFLHGRPLANHDSQLGYGLALVGAWNPPSTRSPR